MDILVTGGAGFIGSNLVDSLINEGHKVVILDDFSTGNRDFVNPESKVVEADIRDADAVNKAFEEYKPEAVFHLAAMIELRESMENPKTSYEVNVTGSQNVINASKEAGVKKFIFASSAAVYGDNQNLPIKESEPVSPTSPYGEQKAATERALKMSKIPSVVLRYSNVYGPRQGTVGEGGVVAVFCKKLVTRASLTVFGDGEQTRDFVYVDDVIEANIKALESDKNKAVYNVSTGVETNINELASTLLSVSKKDTKIEHTKPVEGEVLRNGLDNGLIERELGWEPKTAIKKGLESTWKWFHENVKTQNPNDKNFGI